jgi:hypothetical protein
MGRFPVFGKTTYRGDAWAITVANPARGVLYGACSGHGVLEAAQIFMDAHDAIEREANPVDVFMDWSEVTGYDAEVRQVYVEWARGKRERGLVGTVHILTGSRLVAMGVSVASIVLREIRSCPDRASFERAMALAAARHTPSGSFFVT